ncbi:MAG: bifunctional 5,10-methylenetetrahydrofolate dehydrogenase/5,10-methenyltetrahydrofolate cyclohydrolase [Patescibacteria group bacterium]
MIIVDGRTIAQKVLSQIKTGLNGRSISIAAIWAGDPAPSLSADRHSEKGRAWGGAGNLAIGRFVEMKKKYAESVGIKMIIFHFDSSDSEEKIINKIEELSEDKCISGIIVELPLPERFDRDKILNLIPKEKDIDVLSTSAQESFYNNGTELLPPSVGALKLLFKEYGIDPKGKTVAVFGQSMLIGKPISHWLEQRGAKVFRIDEYIPNPKEFSRQADIIISGVGKPNLIKEDMIKGGVVIVDFGFEKLENKVTGDVDFDSVAPKSSIITPVPGGMGPIVIAAFLKNAVQIVQNSLPKL